MGGSETTRLLRMVAPERVRRSGRAAIDPVALADAAAIIAQVRQGGAAALEQIAIRFGERRAGEPLVLDRADMRRALHTIDAEDRAVLERAAERIAQFARAQRASVRPLTMPVAGGHAGHTVEPVAAAGCYAPGGRYPLPSSALMTAVTAREAGCERVVVASPGAAPIVLAAAAIAGADQFLALGGAHAVAAMAYGFDGLEPVDVIAGPGNKWVTAAKHLVSASVGIDMLAGPSELLVIADDTADAATVAADLLAQAEHDDDAVPMLVMTSRRLADAVERELAAQLQTLDTAPTARRALANGFATVVGDIEQALAVSDRVAPEHLEIVTADAQAVASRVRHAGAVFIGTRAAEVFGDYGVGPNHTLPTGGTARCREGLSVAHFLRLRTWTRFDNAIDPAIIADTERLATIEGLTAHARAAAMRR